MTLWTRDKIILLLEMYKEAECLWNPRNPNHKLANTRHDALKEISIAVEFDVPEVKQKIKYLTGQFYRERMKYRKYKKSGAGSHFISKWFAYNYMLFLKDKNKVNSYTERGLQRQETTTGSSDDETYDLEDSLQGTQTENKYSCNMMASEISQNTDKQSVTQVSSNTSILKPIQVALNSDITKSAPLINNVSQTSLKANSSLTVQIPANPTTSKATPLDNTLNKIDAQKNIINISTSKMSKKKITEDDKQRQEAYLIMKEMYDNKEERDEYKIFGDFVATKLRKLNTNYAKDAVEHLISNILWEASLGKYDYPPQAHPHSRPQSSFSQLHSSEGTLMQSPSLHSNESQSILSQQQSFFEIASPANSTADGLQSGNNPDPMPSECSYPQNDLLSQALFNLN